MDRRTLARVIDAGRTSTLNCFDTTLDFDAVGARIAADDARGPLFRHRLLNRCVVLKVFESFTRGAARVHSVDTLIYFPYNNANIYEGGDAILYSDPRRGVTLGRKCGLGAGGEAQADAVAWDNGALAMLHELPTLDPFLLKSKAEQLRIEHRIHDAYFSISAEEWARIERPIRRKIDRIVRRALGATEAPPAEIRRHVDRFLGKIWEARDVEGIEDFVRSMQISLDRAPGLFFAWKGICYYEVQFNEMQKPMERVLEWIGDPARALPGDYRALPAEMQKQLSLELDLVRDRVRENFLDIARLLRNYEESYRQFVDTGHAGRFRQFLDDADSHYLDLAACLSANAHAINLLESEWRRGNDRLQGERYRELLDSLMAIFGVDPDAGQGSTAPSAARRPAGKRPGARPAAA